MKKMNIRPPLAAPRSADARLAVSFDPIAGESAAPLLARWVADPFDNPYDQLGARESVRRSELTDLRTQAKKVLDVSAAQGDPEATQALQALNTAYEELTDDLLQHPRSSVPYMGASAVHSVHAEEPMQSNAFPSLICEAFGAREVIFDWVERVKPRPGSASEAPVPPGPTGSGE